MFLFPWILQKFYPLSQRFPGQACLHFYLGVATPGEDRRGIWRENVFYVLLGLDEPQCSKKETNVIYCVGIVQDF